MEELIQPRKPQRYQRVEPQRDGKKQDDREKADFTIIETIVTTEQGLRDNRTKASQTLHASTTDQISFRTTFFE